MKKIIALICFGLLITAGPAFASSWSLSPTGTQDTTALAAGAAYDVDLIFNWTGDCSGYTSGVDLDFSIDLSELTPSLNKQDAPEVTWALAGFGTIANSLAGSTLTVAGGNLGGYNALSMGANTIGTIHLLIVAPDGSQDGGDLDLLAQTGLKGIANYNASAVAGFAGAAGPDIGNPGGGPSVPIPGAVYLLFSGLVGIIGLRRRNS